MKDRLIETNGMREKRLGFTMTEMLVVIGILILLFSLGVPAFNRIRNQAMATQCTSKLRNIGIGVTAYLTDNGLTFPELVPGRDSREEDVPVLETVLLDYVRDETVFKCPSDHELYKKTGSSYFWNSMVNGQKLGNMNLLGIITEESGIPLVSDKENFHKHIGGEVNILYADGHVLKELQFNVRMDD